MINAIWLIMLLSGIAAAAWQGQPDLITNAMFSGAEQAVTVAFALIGIISFWSGIMQIAKDARIMESLSSLIKPFARFLFPDIPANHPAMGAILLSISANLLGLGNACTPLGLKAMEEMQSLNRSQDEASYSMCTFVAITTSSLTLIPSTVIAFRAAQNSSDPTAIIGTTIVATAVSTLVAVTIDRLARRLTERR